MIPDRFLSARVKPDKRRHAYHTYCGGKQTRQKQQEDSCCPHRVSVVSLRLFPPAVRGLSAPSPAATPSCMLYFSTESAPPTTPLCTSFSPLTSAPSFQSSTFLPRSVCLHLFTSLPLFLVNSQDNILEKCW